MSDTEVRSVLVPIVGTELLLPNASIAEIVAYTEPAPIADAPAWVLGNVLWHGWQVPVISFGVLTERHSEEPVDEARICIIKSLVVNQKMPYIGILAQGFPRLVTVTEAGLTEVPEPDSHIAIAGHCVLGDREAVIPDLDRIGQLAAHAAYGALPVTH
mgnify:CR=1 FL=1